MRFCSSIDCSRDVGPISKPNFDLVRILDLLELDLTTATASEIQADILTTQWSGQ
jgi:hypothetical protein